MGGVLIGEMAGSSTDNVAHASRDRHRSPKRCAFRWNGTRPQYRRVQTTNQGIRPFYQMTKMGQFVSPTRHIYRSRVVALRNSFSARAANAHEQVRAKAINSIQCKSEARQCFCCGVVSTFETAVARFRID
jgi:hypothetical protein